MENLTSTTTTESALPLSNAASDTAPRKKTMSEAAIAANRANAKKSTGPRTGAGKLKSASNALSHGLYSLTHFDHFCAGQDFVLDILTNIHEQFNPITPTEHMLVAQLTQFELRFIQMDAYYKRIIERSPDDFIDNPPKALNTVLRELNALPGRINRIIKSIHAEQANRENYIRIADDKFEIELIEDQPVLPAPPQQPGPVQKPQNEAKSKYTSGQILFKLFAEQVLRKDPLYAHLVDGELVRQEEIAENEAIRIEALRLEHIEKERRLSEACET